MASNPGALVTGGAGFIGSTICEKLLEDGYRVVCMDNLLTGDLRNVEHLRGDPNFQHVDHDVTEIIDCPGELSEIIDCPGELSEVYHFASPASPKDFSRLSIPILKVGAFGTYNALEIARAKGARFMLASTSEVYGDPTVHPQSEDYQGNVNSIGLRGVYDEAKRYAESLTMAYHRHHGVDTRIARIFNSYGPRMRPDDGRMVPNFIQQALSGTPLTVYGDGSQTRSVQYVDDLVEGVRLLMKSKETRPVNVGNPVEYPVREFAQMVLELCTSNSDLVYEPSPEDDPKQRCPDITRARELLGWEPRVPAKEGLRKTVTWFAERARSSERAIQR